MALVIAGGNLKVTPEVIQAKAQNVEKKIMEIRVAFEEMEQAVSRTKQYWIGEAGDSHRDYFNGKKDDIQIMFRRWDEEVCDMFQISSQYAKTEKEVTSLAENLPFDVIV